MPQWFVQQLDVEIGPISGTELLEMVRQGKVSEQTPIRKDDSAWFAAVEVGGLFDAATSRPRQYHCPDCDGVVSKPPTVCARCGSHLAYAPSRMIDDSPAKGTSGQRPSMQRWLQKIKAPRDEG
jgi:hypothetical protein